MPPKSGCFEVKSYHKVLDTVGSHFFQWKSIWKVKAPAKVLHGGKERFLLWTNLSRKNFCIADWCCMCKNRGESTVHFILTMCEVYGPWCFVCLVFLG